jgi:hypothetical protein
MGNNPTKKKARLLHLVNRLLTVNLIKGRDRFARLLPAAAIVHAGVVAKNIQEVISGPAAGFRKEDHPVHKQKLMSHKITIYPGSPDPKRVPLLLPSCLKMILYR